MEHIVIWQTAVAVWRRVFIYVKSVPPAASLAAFGLLAWTGTAAAELRVGIPAPEGVSDRCDSYFIDLLDLALSKGDDSSFVLVKTSAPMPLQSRGIWLLRAGKQIDVLWAVTTPQREVGLRPIRIPLIKGLLGWRLLLINREDQKRFDGVQSFEDLRDFAAGQGEDCPDVDVFRAHRLPVITGRSHEGLFVMLTKRRFDYFPRSVAEIYDELEAHKGLVVENHLALHYPAAVYFFVNSQREDLATRLEKGLQRALEDGSFDRLFDRYFGAVITKARIRERVVFEMRNPRLPPSVPLDDERYWDCIPGR